MKYLSSTLIALAALGLASLACSLVSGSSGTPPAAATLNELYTAAALTRQASSSQAASATPSATATSPFPTYLPGFPSLTPAPVFACNAAAFIKDVTVPDGTTFDAGEDFIKTWRIQNIGTCSWTPAYALVFVGGDHMNAPGSLSLSHNVNPGQSVDLSVEMTAPQANGSYQGFWKLRNAAGVLFGIGIQAQTSFWVKIKVAGPTYTAYDFAANYCDADWENNSKSLPCPGTEGDGKGYIIRLNHPVMEDGKKQDQAGLLAVPKDIYNGLIAGTYPAVNIHDGDRFQAHVSCQYKAYSCNVILRLAYQIGGGSIKTLGSWNEAYEGKYYPVDVDLSSLKGKNVKFTLVVTANGSPDQDQALWIAPRITRRGTTPPTPTPTATRTPTLTPSPTDASAPPLT